MKLSILIPSLKSRAKKYKELEDTLWKQIGERTSVEIVSDIDNGEKTIGEKRNDLIAKAKGEYIVFVDDDDMVSDDYVQEILSAIESKPDVVTIEGTNGNNPFICKLGRPFEKGNGVHLDGATHLCPVRKELLENFKFPRINYGEDRAYFDFIRYVAQTEVHIPKTLYYYNYVEEKEYDKYRNDDTPETVDKIMIAIPNMAHVHPELMEVIFFWYHTYGPDFFAIYMPQNTHPVERVRNHIVKKFMDSECSHLFFIDSDTIPPRDALATLYNLNVPVATAMTPILKPEGNKLAYPNVAKKEGKIDWNSDTESIDRAGSSCILIKREVFETIKKPYYKTLLDPYCMDIMKGEDTYFCDKVREAGLKIILVPKIICKHAKEFKF